MGAEYANLALLTDGLRAEREQGITIDVAYRYFATPKRKFIIADTPGHIQYTRNMVTGASTADLALVLVDARNGIVEQSRRHAFLASLLRIPHLVLCVNKMDLVDYVRGALRARSRTSSASSRRSSTITDLIVHPDVGPATATTSSTARPTCPGTRARRCCTTSRRCTSRRTATSSTPASRCSTCIRPFIERVPRLPRLRRHASPAACSSPGDEVIVLPSGFTSTIKSIDTADGPVDEAFAPMSVTVTPQRRDRHLAAAT